MSLAKLCVKRGVRRALIVDDAYDSVPEAEDIRGVDAIAVVRALENESDELRGDLGRALVGVGLVEDEYEDGLTHDEVVAELWRLSEAATMTAATSGLLFSNYRTEQAQKKEQLLPLEDLLERTLNLAVEKQGRSHVIGADYDLLFLDLFLGVTDDESALRQAIDRVRRIVQDVDDARRPLVVVMSTKAGVVLSDFAARLQREADLLGCKFRTASKSEFDDMLPSILEQLLKDHPEAQSIAQWLDTWRAAIAEANGSFVSKLRSLDLSDYAYLQKFRLEAEGVGLGSYLTPTLMSFLTYCVEQSSELSRQAVELDNLTFNRAPYAHFLPSERVAELSHARTFLNRTAIEATGYQFKDAGRRLQLGDVIVKLPSHADGYGFQLDGMEAFVVITQACDIQQRNADSFLMLRGSVYRRDWAESLKPGPSRTDIFVWNDVQYSLDWERAQVVTTKVSTMEARLKPNGSHARIARFRDVEALRLQNVFSSNLTRVGTAVSFHHTTKVGLELWAKGTNGPERLYAAAAEESVAAIIDGRLMEASNDERKPKTKFERVLVLHHMTPEKLADGLKAADYANVADPQAAALKAFAESTEDLSKLHAQHRIGKSIEINKGLKFELLMRQPDAAWTGGAALVLVVATPPDAAVG